MILKTLVHSVERLFTKRAPKAYAGSFFTSGMAIVVIGYLRESQIATMYWTILAAAVVSLLAIGLRWVEQRCPDADESQRHRH